MSSIQKKILRFKSRPVAVNYEITPSHRFIHQTLSKYFDTYARVKATDPSFRSALNFFSRAKVWGAALSRPGKADTSSASLDLFCLSRSFFRPNVGGWLQISVSPLSMKENKEEAEAQEKRYAKLVAGKWDLHGKKNAEDIKQGLSSNMALVVNAVRFLDAQLRLEGAKLIGTHTPHQDNLVFGADPSAKDSNPVRGNESSYIRKDYILKDHLVTITTKAEKE